nr:S-layer homology domain-containing protein [Paenibacillus pasadenensis]
MRGDEAGRFRPDAAVTRAEWIVMLERQRGGAAPLASGTFADQASIPAWASDAIGAALAGGILSGYEDRSFRPHRPVTREELAAMLVRTTGASLGDDGSVPRFADEEAIPAWAKPFVYGAAGEGLLQGRGGGRFGAEQPATRAEAAVLLTRLSERG